MPITVAKSQKSENTSCCLGCKQELLFIADGMQNSAAPLEGSLAASYNAK